MQQKYDFEVIAPVTNPHTNTGKPFLLANFNKITVQWNDAAPDWKMTFNVTDDHGETFSFTEAYSPIEYQIAIHDINELLRPYFNLSDHPGLVGFGTMGLKSLGDSRRVSFSLTKYSASTHSLGTYIVAYSNAPTGFLHTGTGNDGIGSRFLSRCNLLKASDSQPCAVSFFGHGETLKVKVLHYATGIPQLTEVVSVVAPDSDNMQTYNFTLENLAVIAGINEKDIIYADVQLFRNSAPQDSIRFMREPYHRAHERTFAFIGALGEPEFVVLTGKEQREAEFEGVFQMEHNDYRKADTTLHLLHSSYTGALNEGERLLIWDMAASPWVYVIENGQLREVTITEVELTDSIPHMEPTGYRVKWRYTNELGQRNFTRVQNVPIVRVFDTTFDRTFN